MTAKATSDDLVAHQRGVGWDKRQAIIEAAQELFTTIGYESTTMAQVAKKAGVAVGTTYLYFKNKNDLLVAVKGGWEIEVLRAFALPGLEQLPHHLRARPMLEACFEICARQTELVQLMGMQAELVGDWHTKVPAPIQAALKAFLDEALAAGSIRQLDTEAAAVILYGMVNGALLQCFVSEDGRSKDRYIDLLVDAIQRWLISPEVLPGETQQTIDLSMKTGL